jgi:proline utilization trans-activator
VIDENYIKERVSWVQRALTLLDCMVSAGNLVASWRKSELQQLDQMMGSILNIRRKVQSSSEVSCTSLPLQIGFQPETSAVGQDAIHLQSFNMMSFGNGDDISAEQIMAIASSIQEEDVEWMDRAVAENRIW